MELSLIYRSKIIVRAYEGWISLADRVLDIGCGNAVVTEELRKHFCCNFVGTDVLSYCQRNIPFKLMGNPDKLPFCDQEFEIAMFNDTLHHCYNVEAILNEALRVARKILVFEVEPTLIVKITDMLANQIHNQKMNKAVNLNTSGYWRAYFKDLGFDFEFRKVKKPSPFWIPNNFAFKLSKNNIR